jgi:hypothetical protein
MRQCRCDSEVASAGHGWGRGFAARSRSGQGCGHRRGSCHDEPTQEERKEALEAFKKHLEERLADVNDELGKL